MKKQIATNDALKADALLSQAIEANGLIFVSGQVHCTSDGTLVDGSTKEKLAQIMQNLSAILTAAGTTIDSVVKVVIYVTEMSLMSEINEVYSSYFSAPLPAREAVCVKELPLGASIEISVIASQ